MSERIVVLGGGFAGVSTARELSKQLRREDRLAAGPQDDGVSVTLINRDNYFVFQPLLADIISGAIETTHVVVPLRRLLHGLDVEVGYVDEIDPIRKRVSVRRRQSGEVFSVAYDALVVALGSITDFRAVPGMAEHAIGVRTLGDAFYLRNRALAQLEEAANEPDSARREALLTFVVVGGGSTGVEVAAELEDLLRTAHRTFASLPKPNVVLVHSRPYVLPGVRRSPRPVRDEEAGSRRGAGDPRSAPDPRRARPRGARRRQGHRHRDGHQHRWQRTEPRARRSCRRGRRSRCARLGPAGRDVRRARARTRVGAW